MKDESKIQILTALTLVATASSLVTSYLLLCSRKKERERKHKRLETVAQKPVTYTDKNDVTTEPHKAIPYKHAAQRDFSKVGVLMPLSVQEVYLLGIENLKQYFESEAADDTINSMHGRAGKSLADNFASPGNNAATSANAYNQLITKNECVIGDVVRKPGGSTSSFAYVRAGPRPNLHFDPKTVNAAIVTCGGLCPGLNNVIREITNALYNLYGIGGKVYGIVGGYKGFYDLEPRVLTPTVVENIHHEGGTFLGSSRGGFDIDKIMIFLEKYDIRQLYVIGGDGTHRGAFRIHEECLKRSRNISVAGIPKTIDNDVDYIDRSFGFQSAVQAAQSAIRTAKTEASCNLPNGIGIVKLMGRSAGYIAVHATLGSGDVDLCLVPEVPIVLDDPKQGCLPHLFKRVKKKGFGVVVVAEGAGEELMGKSAEVDKSGNRKLPKIGEFMKEQCIRYFKEQGEEATVKYIDPSYMIRTVPANASDSLYCLQLAQNAVHGSMAGYTGFSVGLCNNKVVLLPIPQLVATSPRSMNPFGRTWERVLGMTLQPNTTNLLKNE